jgi:hypothetical protein
MLSHLSISSGQILIGYGITENCPKCNNRIVQQVYCTYTEHKSLFVRAGFDVERPRAICYICGNIFIQIVSQLIENPWQCKEHTQLIEILWQGKEHTKNYFQKIGYFDRKRILRILKRLKFDDLLNYLKIP